MPLPLPPPPAWRWTCATASGFSAPFAVPLRARPQSGKVTTCGHSCAISARHGLCRLVAWPCPDVEFGHMSADFERGHAALTRGNGDFGRTFSLMRILISADMEGATGVTWTDDVVPGTEQWQRFRRLLTGDVNATIAGLCAGGATDLLVNEAHSAQRNLLLEDLDVRA